MPFTCPHCKRVAPDDPRQDAAVAQIVAKTPPGVPVFVNHFCADCGGISVEEDGKIRPITTGERFALEMDSPGEMAALRAVQAGILPAGIVIAPFNRTRKP